MLAAAKLSCLLNKPLWPFSFKVLFQLLCALILVFYVSVGYSNARTNTSWAGAGTAILGRPELTAEQLNWYIKKLNPDAPEIAQHFIELGCLMGIRGDIAFAQAILETGYFKYGGDVASSQNNFAGIGAVGGGEKGASFNTAREGVLAHLQHLWAYATTEPLIDQTIIDPRFHLVERGSSATWEALGGKWDVPGYNQKKYASFEEAFVKQETYGQKILKIYQDIKRQTESGREKDSK